MTFLTHAALGTIIGKKQNNILKIAFLAYLSHFLLDAVPHNDYFYYYLDGFSNIYLSPLSILIGILTVIVIFFLVKKNRGHRGNLIIGAFFSVLPDVLSGVYYKTHSFAFSYLDSIHFFFHSKIDLGVLFYAFWEKAPFPQQRLHGGLLDLQLLNSSTVGSLGLALESTFEIFVLLFFLREVAKR